MVERKESRDGWVMSWLIDWLIEEPIIIHSLEDFSKITWFSRGSVVINRIWRETIIIWLQINHQWGRGGGQKIYNFLLLEESGKFYHDTIKIVWTPLPPPPPPPPARDKYWPIPYYLLIFSNVLTNTFEHPTPALNFVHGFQSNLYTTPGGYRTTRPLKLKRRKNEHLA